MEVVDYLLGKNSSGGGEEYKPKAISFYKNQTTLSDCQNIAEDIKNIDFSDIESFQYFISVSNRQNTRDVTLDLRGCDLRGSNVAFSNKYKNFLRQCEFKKIIIDDTTLFDVNTLNNTVMMFNEIGCEEFIMSGQNFHASSYFLNGSYLKHVDLSQSNIIADYLDSWFSYMKYCEIVEIDNLELSKASGPTSQLFKNCGVNLPSGTYTKVYVKNATEQSFILGLSSIPSGWSTSNVIIAGSSDDHRND